MAGVNFAPVNVDVPNSLAILGSYATGHPSSSLSIAS
jgi:hypothetical protein